MAKTAQFHFGRLPAVLVLAALPFSVEATSLGFAPDPNWRASPETRYSLDAVTGDNEFASSSSAGERRWTIDLGADVYAEEKYERPTIQNTDSLDVQGTQRAYTTYFEFLDIRRGANRLDTQAGIAYFGIELFGRNEIDQDGFRVDKGFTEHYRIRTADNPEFTNGHLWSAVDPESKMQLGWQNETTKAWVDADGDIQASVPNQGGTGYDAEFLNTQSAHLAAQIDGLWVDLAIDFSGLGLDPSIFAFAMFEATEGLTDVQNYFWNDKYSFQEGGSPYTDQGVGNVENIYELDTLPLAPIPVPAALPLMMTGLGWLGFVGWRRRRVSR
jgi:hypothetical protein